MITKIKILMLLVVFSTLSVNLNAQTRSRLSKIGFVDSSAVYNDISEDEDLLKAIDVKFEKDAVAFELLVDEIKKINSEISTLKREINSSENPAALEKQLATLETKLDTLQEQYKTLSPIINMRKSKKKQSISVEVQRHIASAIITITRREGYTAILERKNDNILYVDKDFDITTQIIAFVRTSIKNLGN